jgi:hypothetical protein
MVAISMHEYIFFSQTKTVQIGRKNFYKEKVKGWYFGKLRVVYTAAYDYDLAKAMLWAHDCD